METQCIVDFEGNITAKVFEDCPKAALDEFQDQSLSIFSSTNQWIVITLVVFLLGCVTMNLIGKTFIMWYAKFQSIDRPLNALIVLDQGIQLLPVLVNGIGTTVCLILKKPLVSGHLHWAQGLQSVVHVFFNPKIVTDCWGCRNGCLSLEHLQICP